MHNNRNRDVVLQENNRRMKCQNCEKPATFHITDLTGDELLALHLCADCAREYLQPDSVKEPTPTVSNVIKHQLKLEQTTEELKELDARVCPVCGISFYEFRQAGRLGCPHDYVVFGEELEALLMNVHGAVKHIGKRPKRAAGGTMDKTEVIRLRREMKEAVEVEDYERAKELRDKIRAIEGDH